MISNTPARQTEAGLPACRPDFPALNQEINGRPLVYLDNAATTQKPRAVIDAITRFYERDNANVHRAEHALGLRATEAFESARARAARFIHSRSPDEIIFTRGTTESINLVANAWAAKFLQPGDAILVTEMEHHSNFVPWQMLAQRTGAKLLAVPVAGFGQIDMKELDRLLAPPVKLFAFAHVSNVLGTINPVGDFCALARARSIVTLVDAAQSAGHMPIDVQALGCDFLAFSGHKMCGPTGIGVLFGRAELLDAMPPWQGGGEMIRRVDFSGTTFAEPPCRFEAGTPDIAGAVGLHAAMDYLDAIGLERIFQHDQQLAACAIETLEPLKGIRWVGPRQGRAGVVSFVFPDAHAHDLVTLADQSGVALRCGHHCAQPLMRRLGVDSAVRASFYFYNTMAEIDRLVEALREARAILAKA